MRIRTLRYCISQGFIGIYKNRLMSLAAIGTISACLFIFGLTYCIAANIDFMLENLDDSLGITAFLTKGTTQKEIDELIHKIEARAEVKSVKYISPEEAWNNFKKDFEGEEAILQGLQNDNPLGDSASLEIHLYDASSQQNFVNFLETLQGIRHINYSKETADIFISFSLLIRYISLALIVILIFIALLLIANTIKLAVYIRRYEINIMKYIGAKDSFIRLPFIVEGMIMGAVGATIPLLIVKYSYNYIINLIYKEFPFLNNLFNFLGTKQILAFLIPVFFVMGIGIGVIGSGISIKKYLKV